MGTARDGGGGQALPTLPSLQLVQDTMEAVGPSHHLGLETGRMEKMGHSRGQQPASPGVKEGVTQGTPFPSGTPTPGSGVDLVALPASSSPTA